MTDLGSARFYDGVGVQRETILTGGGICFGRVVPPGRNGNPAKAIDTYCASGIAKHFFSIASTRSGKGTTLIIPNLLLYNGSAIVIDPKGENAWITAERRRKMGQKTFILDPWGEVNRRYGSVAEDEETISCFNPLSILDPHSDEYSDDLAYLADALIINSGKDPYWEDSAKELVSGLISYIVETQGKQASLPMLKVLLSKPHSQIAALALEAQELGVSSLAARKLGRFTVESKSMSDVIQSALTQTAILDSTSLQRNLSTTDFSFDELVNGYATIFLVLPTDKLMTYGRWLRLLINIAIRTISRHPRKLKRPVLFVLDEFGTIGRLNAVVQAYGLMAGLNMCMWAFVQDLPQLKKDYPDEWQTFIGNSECVTFFNVNDQFTCEYVSKMLGTQTVERISEYTAEQRKKDPSYTGMRDTYYSRDLLQPAEVRGFNPNLGISIAPSHEPIVFTKDPYYEDRDLKQMARCNPMFEDMPIQLTSEQLDKVNRIMRNEDQRIFDNAKQALEEAGYTFEMRGLFKKSLYIISQRGKKFPYNDNHDLITVANRELKGRQSEKEAYEKRINAPSPL